MLAEELPIVFLDPSEIKLSKPFSTLFPVVKSVAAGIEASMREVGFDPSRPLNVWQEEWTLVDGHTRMRCALAVGIDRVPVCFHNFADEGEALRYAIDAQRNRRNITDADILRCIEAVDERKKSGERTDLASHEARSGKSAEETARIVGISRAKVERARRVIHKAPPEVKQAVLSGEMSINQGAKLAAKPEKMVEPKEEPIAEEPKADGDEAWLESFEIRSKVKADRFDMDARLYKAFLPQLKEMLRIADDLAGPTSEVGKTHIHWAIWKLAKMEPIDVWSLCSACKGGPGQKGRCSKCRGCGYKISPL